MSSPQRLRITRALDTITDGLGRLLTLVSTLMVIAGFVAFGLFDRGPSYRPLAEPSKPIKLYVPGASTTAPLAILTTSSTPKRAGSAGWIASSAKVGASTGRTVLIGDSTGKAGERTDRIIDLAADASKGDRLEITTKNGTMSYQVTEKRNLSSADFTRRRNRLVRPGKGTYELLVLRVKSDRTTLVKAKALGVRVG